MGCLASSRSEAINVTMPPEERSFEREALLRFGKVPADALFKAATHHGTLNNQLTLPKLKQLLAETGLETKGLESFESPVRKFYVNFLKDRLYDCRQVKLLGILLSPGTVQMKSKLLFDEFDNNGNKTLDAAEVTAMVGLLVHIALVQLPVFSVETAKAEKKLEEVSVMLNYCGKLEQARMKVTGFIRGLICTSNSVSYADFMSSLENTNAKVLFEAAKLRALCLNLEILDQDVKKTVVIAPEAQVNRQKTRMSSQKTSRRAVSTN